MSLNVLSYPLKHNLLNFFLSSIFYTCQPCWENVLGEFSTSYLKIIVGGQRSHVLNLCPLHTY